MKHIPQIIGVFALVLFALPIMAQPGGGDPTPGVPIDGGASALAAAGIAYGIKKYRDMRKEAE